MKTRSSYLVIAVLLAAVPSCFAADNPWNGTWKLNRAKSKMTGDTFAITSTKDGLHFSDGSVENYDFACNGKPYPTLADRTVTCSGTPSGGFDFQYMAAGHVLSKSHHALSPDGKTLTIQGTEMHPDGTTSTFEEVYTRVSGTSGLEGKWKNVKEKSNAPETFSVHVKDGVMQVSDPVDKVTYDARLDGTQTAVLGPTIPEGATISIKMESPTRVHYVEKYKDKTLWEGTQTLSADGKVMTDEEWEAGKPTEKMVGVYEKQ